MVPIFNLDGRFVQLLMTILACYHIVNGVVAVSFDIDWTSRLTLCNVVAEFNVVVVAVTLDDVIRLTREHLLYVPGAGCCNVNVEIGMYCR